MRAKSAVHGLAAAAAFSSAACAFPCAGTSLTNYTTSGFTCAINDRTLSAVIHTAHGDAGPAVSGGGPNPTTSQSPIALEDTDPADLEEAKIFTGGTVKITNLQATMTSNAYVASPPVARSSPIEDLIMYSPDYMSVKSLPRVPKRKPVGVGLVTVPAPNVKKSDTAPGNERPQR
jgi:hypothetical protein